VTAAPDWVDRLVELHVLAEHGDAASATAAEQWLAGDVQARQVWESVEHLRDQLQAVPTSIAEPPTGLNSWSVSCGSRQAADVDPARARPS
jgi:ferric-dicitrate binding protein FerR (iron transport regulator)